MVPFSRFPSSTWDTPLVPHARVLPRAGVSLRPAKVHLPGLGWALVPLGPAGGSGTLLRRGDPAGVGGWAVPSSWGGIWGSIFPGPQVWEDGRPAGQALWRRLGFYGLGFFDILLQAGGSDSDAGPVSNAGGCCCGGIPVGTPSRLRRGDGWGKTHKIFPHQLRIWPKGWSISSSVPGALVSAAAKPSRRDCLFSFISPLMTLKGGSTSASPFTSDTRGRCHPWTRKLHPRLSGTILRAVRACRWLTA